MLKLLIYAPCEKAIVSTDNTSSVISIMESVSINVPEDLPADALAPIRWTVFSLWKRDQSLEQPTEMEERTDVLRADGTVAAGASSRFTASNEHLFYRSVVQVPVFPIGLPGFVNVRCRLRQTNPETEWEDIAEFPLLVVHLKADIPDNVTPESQEKAPES